ncbi:MAG: hypothetical protein ABR985_16195 [Methanotrichaceae archaeon]
MAARSGWPPARPRPRGLAASELGLHRSSSFPSRKARIRSSEAGSQHYCLYPAYTTNVSANRHYIQATEFFSK